MSYMSDEAKQAKNAYQREWRSRNKDKDKKYQEKYWLSKSKNKEGAQC